jgi:hypothetical protein
MARWLLILPINRTEEMNELVLANEPPTLTLLVLNSVSLPNHSAGVTISASRLFLVERPAAASPILRRPP